MDASAELILPCTRRRAANMVTVIDVQQTIVGVLCRGAVGILDCAWLRTGGQY